MKLVENQYSLYKDPFKDALRKMAVGAEITYADFFAQFKIDAPTPAHHDVLRKARKAVESEGCYVMAIRPKIGLRRGTSEDTARTTGIETRGVHRKSRRALIRAMHCTQPQDLDPDSRQQLYADISVLGVLTEASAPRTRKLLAVKVGANSAGGPLPLEATLSAFKELGPRKEP